MTCLHSSDGMDDTWTRKPSPTARWLLISPESRKGMLNTVFRDKGQTFHPFSSLTHLFVVLHSMAALIPVSHLMPCRIRSVLRAWWGPWPLRSCWKACLFCRLRLTHSWSLMWVTLWFDLYTYLTGWCSITRQRLLFSFSISGSPQGTEQWDHQCCISAPLQGPGQTVCILQWRNHQPIRSIVHENLLLDTSKM